MAGYQYGGNQYEKCGATTDKNSKGFSYRCNKKAGHKDSEHADTKNVPVYRWKDKAVSPSAATA